MPALALSSAATRPPVVRRSMLDEHVGLAAGRGQAILGEPARSGPSSACIAHRPPAPCAGSIDQRRGTRHWPFSATVRVPVLSPLVALHAAGDRARPGTQSILATDPPRHLTPRRPRARFRRRHIVGRSTGFATDRVVVAPISPAFARRLRRSRCRRRSGWRRPRSGGSGSLLGDGVLDLPLPLQLRVALRVLPRRPGVRRLLLHRGDEERRVARLSKRMVVVFGSRKTFFVSRGVGRASDRGRGRKCGRRRFAGYPLWDGVELLAGLVARGRRPIVACDAQFLTFLPEVVRITRFGKHHCVFLKREPPLEMSAGPETSNALTRKRSTEKSMNSRVLAERTACSDRRCSSSDAANPSRPAPDETARIESSG